MTKWKRIGRSEVPDGVTITYSLPETDYTVESRKRLVPHSARSGGWWYTSYFILRKGKEIGAKHSLKDAQEVAEMLNERDKFAGKHPEDGGHQ